MARLVLGASCCTGTRKQARGHHVRCHDLAPPHKSLLSFRPSVQAAKATSLDGGTHQQRAEGRDAAFRAHAALDDHILVGQVGDSIGRSPDQACCHPLAQSRSWDVPASPGLLRTFQSLFVLF